MARRIGSRTATVLIAVAVAAGTASCTPQGSGPLPSLTGGAPVASTPSSGSTSPVAAPEHTPSSAPAPSDDAKGCPALPVVPDLNEGMAYEWEILTRAEASSTLPPEGDFTYVARNIESWPETAWVEGAPDDGVGQSLTLSFGGQLVVVGGFAIANGYWKSAELLAANNRVARFRVDFDDGTSESIDLDDPVATGIFGTIVGFEQFHFGCEHAVRSMTFTIEATYPGSTWNDTAISTLIPFGRGHT